VGLVPVRTKAHLSEQLAWRHGPVEVLLPIGVHGHDVHATGLQSEYSIREVGGMPDRAAAGVLLSTGAACA
jgi:hypothetical protein